MVKNISCRPIVQGLSLILYLFIFVSFDKPVSGPEPIVVLDKLTVDADFVIPNWRLYGPFNSDELLSLEDENQYQGCYGQIIQPDSLKNKMHAVSEKLVRVDDFIKVVEPSTIFISTNIESKEEQDVVFLIGCDGSSEIYFNGEIHRISSGNSTFKINGHKFFTKLRKGNNTIIIKSSDPYFRNGRRNKKKEWRLSCTLVSPERYYNTHNNLEQDFLLHPVVPVLDHIELRDNFHYNFPVSNVALVDKNNVVIKDSLPRNSNSILLPSTLKEDLYKLVIRTKLNSYTQNFYYGDIENAFERFLPKAIRKTEDEETPEQTKLDLSGIIERYNLLVAHYSKQSGCIIENSLDGQKFNSLHDKLTISSRFLALDRSNFIRLKSKHKSSSAISEIDFYDQDLMKIQLSPEHKNPIFRAISDDNNSTSWIPKENKPIVFDFTTLDKPAFIRLKNVPSDYTRLFERRQVFLYKELMRHFNNGNGNNSGIHLKGYISEIEGEPQYYISHVPKKYNPNKKPLPLVVILPVVSVHHLHFLKGNQIANLRALQQTQFLANKHETLVIQPSARTYQYPICAPIAFNDVNQAIDSAIENFNIDKSRIYLYTFCGGTSLALSLAQSYPDKFAALSIGNGIIQLRPDNTWEELNLPIKNTAYLKSTPTYIIHNEEDSHTPIRIMDELVRVSELNGADIDYEILSNTVPEVVPLNYLHNRMFSFFDGKRKIVPDSLEFTVQRRESYQSFWIKLWPKSNKSNARVKANVKANRVNISVENTRKICLMTDILDFDKSKKLTVQLNTSSYTFSPPFHKEIVIDLNGEVDIEQSVSNVGPILEAFGESFIVVQGTKGNSDQRKSVKRITEEFSKLWEKLYFMKPRLIQDLNVGSQEILNHNLILIGNQHTNKILKKIYQKIPFKINDKSLEIVGKSFGGDSLGYYTIFRNPLNLDKFIVLIGSNDLDNMELVERNIAVDGFFNYEVYDYNSGTIEQGNYLN